MPESVRRVTFTVDGDGISPSTPQWAGVQGEHQATLIEFMVPDLWQQRQYQYRLEYIDGMQSFFTSGILQLVGSSVQFLLPSAWTAAGGTGEIRLAVYQDGETENDRQLIYSRVGRLTFSTRDENMPSVAQVENSLSHILARMEKIMQKNENILQDSSFEYGQCMLFGNGMMIYYGQTEIQAGEPYFITFPTAFEKTPVALINTSGGQLMSAGELNHAIMVLYDETYSGSIQWTVFGKRKMEE
jgi:hypothetical protein